MKKLPYDFKSWVSLYDFLIEKGLKRHQTITFETYNYKTQTISDYSISMATVEKHAWNEIQKYRLGANDTYHAISGWYAFPPNDERIGKAKELLFNLKLVKHE